MRVVIQRVKKANVSVGGKIVGEISQGLLVLFAVHVDDTADKADKMAEKIAKLRIFSDAEDKMNLSVLDIGGEVLAVSQFTLYGDTRGQNRPGFTESARPEKALPFYERFVKKLEALGIRTATGQFGEAMEVGSVNDGPVTIIIDL